MMRAERLLCRHKRRRRAQPWLRYRLLLPRRSLCLCLGWLPWWWTLLLLLLSMFLLL